MRRSVVVFRTRLFEKGKGSPIPNKAFSENSRQRAFRKCNVRRQWKTTSAKKPIVSPCERSAFFRCEACLDRGLPGLLDSGTIHCGTPHRWNTNCGSQVIISVVLLGHLVARSTFLSSHPVFWGRSPELLKTERRKRLLYVHPKRS